MGTLNGVNRHVLSNSRLNDLKSQTSWGSSAGEILPLIIVFMVVLAFLASKLWEFYAANLRII